MADLEQIADQAEREALAPYKLAQSYLDDDADVICTPLTVESRLQQSARASQIVELACALMRSGTREYSRAVVSDLLRIARECRDALA